MAPAKKAENTSLSSNLPSGSLLHRKMVAAMIKAIKPETGTTNKYISLVE